MGDAIYKTGLIFKEHDLQDNVLSETYNTLYTLYLCLWYYAYNYLPPYGILQIPNLSNVGILGTEPDYFPTQQPLLWNSNINKR